MENENTNENKKKQKIMILIGVVTLLIAVLGATYAYFQISTDTESSNTNITGSTPPKSLVTLKQGTNNLHLNISASDMSYENKTKEYYGTDDDQPYVGTEELGTKTIATVELTGGEETTKYSCTAKLTVSKVTEPLEEADTMIEVLQPDDMILQFKGNIISEQLDLSELKENNPKEYSLSFKITGNKVENIQAYIKLLNKETPQNYLSGKKLNIDINTSDLNCNVYIQEPTMVTLRKNDSQNKLSSDIVGNMYRYQGTNTDEINNYICFGTDKKEECINEETGYDKYMYRILGITEEGQFKLIKMKGVTSDGDNIFKWLNDDSKDAEWPNSDIYKRLNGETSNGEPIFINNSRYEYMVDGNSWYNKIENHNWLYGDVADSISNTILNGVTVYGAKNNGLILYDIETGIKPTQHYEKTNFYNFKIVKHQWNAEKSVNAKIGLMYLHDYYLAYDNERNWYSDYDTSNWIFVNNNKNTTGESYEYLMSHVGTNEDGDVFNTWLVKGNGDAARDGLAEPGVVRPTFYLSSDVTIDSGSGTISDPYILEI